MAVRKIQIWPDPALSTVADKIVQFDETLQQVVEDMFATMYKASGIGLAAPQIAVSKRLLVLDLSPYGETKDGAEELAQWGYEAGAKAFINPRILESEGEIMWDEGCLSLPGVTVQVKRKESVVVEAQDRDGKSFLTEAHGLFAVALQHEMDHLDGVTFADHLSKLKRDVVRRKMQRLKADHTEDGVEAAEALAEGDL